jgi:hypothetical protein
MPPDVAGPPRARRRPLRRGCGRRRSPEPGRVGGSALQKALAHALEEIILLALDPVRPQVAAGGAARPMRTSRSSSSVSPGFSPTASCSSCSTSRASSPRPAT